MIKIATMIYYICVVVMSVTMTISGFDILTPQFWIILSCMIAARICGREEDKS